MYTPNETWRSMPRSPSHESVNTDLSLFSVSSAASDAKVLRLLASKAGQGPEPSLRMSSPNPEGKPLKRPSSCLPLSAIDNCRELLVDCAALCAALGMRRSFSAGDIVQPIMYHCVRNATSDCGLSAALETLSVSAPRSASTWAAPGGSTLPSPQRTAPPAILHADTKKVRQSYIKRRLLSTYRALERMSQSEFNLDKLEAAAVSAVSSVVPGPGPTTLTVPNCSVISTRFDHPDAVHLALTSEDLERERGRPLSKYERNMMIFNWLHTLDEAEAF